MKLRKSATEPYFKFNYTANRSFPDRRTSENQGKSRTKTVKMGRSWHDTIFIRNAVSLASWQQDSLNKYFPVVPLLNIQFEISS